MSPPSVDELPEFAEVIAAAQNPAAQVNDRSSSIRLTRLTATPAGPKVFVKLETIPKATYHKRAAEREFYEKFFDRVSAWALFDSDLAETAFVAACNAGLSAIDSLHIAAAHQTRCEEFVTTEKPNKPLHRTNLIAIKSIHS